MKKVDLPRRVWTISVPAGAKVMSKARRNAEGPVLPAPTLRHAVR
jgi:hypothetical protein